MTYMAFNSTVNRHLLSLSLGLFFFFFLLGITPSKTEQPLQGMELQEKEAKKD